MKEKMKNLGSFLLRFGLSGALLYWLFTKVDFKNMWRAIEVADMKYLAAAGFVFIVITGIILWRWRILMSAVGLKVSRFDSIRWYLIGLFCNLFLPTSVGGDVVKGLGVAKITGDKPKVFASIVLDRLAGFGAIVIVATGALMFGHRLLQDVTVLWAVALMAVLSLTLAVILFSNHVFKFCCRIFKPWPKVRDSLMKLHDNIVLLKDRRGHFWCTVCLSIIAQILLAVTFYLTAQGMHQDTPLVYFILFSPIVCVVTSLPSIGGLGVREIGWVYLLAKVGVDQGAALGLSLINFGFMVLVGLVGGALYVFTLSSRRVQHHQAGAVPRGKKSRR